MTLKMTEIAKIRYLRNPNQLYSLIWRFGIWRGYPITLYRWLLWCIKMFGFCLSLLLVKHEMDRPIGPQIKFGDSIH